MDEPNTNRGDTMSDETPKTWSPKPHYDTLPWLRKVLTKKPEGDHVPMEGTLPTDLSVLSLAELEKLLLTVEDEMRKAEFKAGDDSNFSTFAKTFGLACIVGLFTLSGVAFATKSTLLGVIGLIGLLLFSLGSFIIRPYAKHVSITARNHDRDRILRAIDRTSNGTSCQYRL